MSKRLNYMTRLKALLRNHLVKLVALAAILALFGFSQLPRLSSSERAAMASRFAFTRAELPELTGQSYRSVRDVHPDLERISAWISSVGASVALNDLDGDGLPNDVCYVDPRVDKAIIAPAPGTPARYEPFALNPAPLPYKSATTAPMGCLPNDMNEDGLMDILVYYWGRTPIAFLRSASSALRADSYVPREVLPSGEEWFTNAATFADLDGDGHADLIIGNYFQENSGILDASATNDAEMQRSMSRAYNAGRNRILLWEGATAGQTPAVQFKEVEGVLDEKTTLAWTLAVGAADLDGDLLPELYFANDFGPDRLLHNRSKPGRPSFERLSGNKTLTTPNSKVLGRDSFKGMGIDFGDLNGDGLLDMYVSNIAAEYMLEESHFAWVSTGKPGLMKEGVAPYVDRSEPLGLSRSGWAWESRLGDFDNDGVLEALQATGFVKGDTNRWPELHEIAMGNDELLSNPKAWHRFQPGDDLSGRQHNPFFVRARDGRYFDLARELGIDQLQVARGIATADVDGDGDLDFAVANQWERSYLYINNSPKAGAFLGLHLLLPVGAAEPGGIVARPGHPKPGEVKGRPAIGASVSVRLPDGKRLVAQVDGGNGHSGKRSPDIHLGLGRLPRDAQLPVELRWRDASGVVHEQTLLLSPGWHTVLLK